MKTIAIAIATTFLLSFNAQAHQPKGFERPSEGHQQTQRVIRLSGKVYIKALQEVYLPLEEDKIVLMSFGYIDFSKALSKLHIGSGGDETCQDHIVYVNTNLQKGEKPFHWHGGVCYNHTTGEIMHF